jgi:hypothetical protein
MISGISGASILVHDSADAPLGASAFPREQKVCR